MTSCGENGQQSTSNDSQSTTQQNYVGPKVPEQITDEQERANYTFSHFWEDFDFSDTLKVQNPDYGEQAVANFIGYFPLVPKDSLVGGISRLFALSSVEKGSFNYMKYQLENYLSNPNSPMRNDVFYEAFITSIIGSDQIDQIDKIRYQTRLEMVRKNQPGTQATNFSFLTAKGETMELNAVEAPFSILMFYAPGCPSCEESISIMKNNPAFNTIIEKAGLAIIAVYPDGNEQIWKDYQVNIPDTWINGLDTKQTVLGEGLYVIPATPTIYLLDKDKKVLLKDTDILQIVRFFQSI